MNRGSVLWAWGPPSKLEIWASPIQLGPLQPVTGPPCFPGDPIPVGYSTCHWCHMMEEESFQNEEIGRLLNEDFVSVKVDREERPDVDKVYMTFVQVSGLP